MGYKSNTKGNEDGGRKGIVSGYRKKNNATEQLVTSLSSSITSQVNFKDCSINKNGRRDQCSCGTNLFYTSYLGRNDFPQGLGRVCYYFYNDVIVSTGGLDFFYLRYGS